MLVPNIPVSEDTQPDIFADVEPRLRQRMALDSGVLFYEVLEHAFALFQLTYGVKTLQLRVSI